MPSGLRTHVQKNYLISTGGGIGGKYDGITVTETETVLFVGMKEWNSAVAFLYGNLRSFHWKKQSAAENFLRRENCYSFCNSGKTFI